MKILTLIKSGIASKKTYFILTLITLIFSSAMFNFAFNATSEYIMDLAYIEKNQYDSSVAICEFTSFEPITKERINKMLSDNKIDAQWYYFMNGNELFDSSFPLQSYDEYMKTIETNHTRYLSKIKGMLYYYDKEYSEFLDTGFIGEKPDSEKDYEGYLPVIAGANAGLDIGMTAEYIYLGKKINIKVVGKYTDDNIRRYLENLKEPENSYFTDMKILYKLGIMPAPDELPSFIEYNKTQDEFCGIRYEVKILLLNSKDAPFPETLAKIRNMGISDGEESDIFHETDLFRGEMRGGSVSGNTILFKELLTMNNQVLIMLIPLFITIFIIGTLGIIASVILSTDKNIKSTAVYKLCGCKNRTIILVSVITEAFTVLLSLAISLIICGIINLFINVNIISPMSIMLSTAYILLLFIIMTATEIITLLKSRTLDTIRRFETL